MNSLGKHRAAFAVVAWVDAPLRYTAVNENRKRNQDLNPHEFVPSVHLHTSARVAKQVKPS